MANKRGGLSAREYAAKQSGGKLDYKTGKISTPAPKVSSATQSKPSNYNTYSNQYGGFMSQAQIDANKGPRIANTPSQINNALAYQNQQSSNIADASSKNKSSGSSKAYSQPTPTPVNAPAKSTRSVASTVGNVARGVLGAGLTAAKNIIPGASAASNLLHSQGFDLTDLLGVPRAQGAWDNYTADQAKIDQEASGIQKADLSNMGYVFDDSGRVNTAQSQQNINNRTTGTSNQNNIDRTPKKTTNQPYQTPFYQPQQSNNLTDAISSYQSRQEAPQEFQSAQQEGGTVRQPFGDGRLSNGVSSNGQGNYGVAGAVGVGGSSQWEDALRSILGINTAKASGPSIVELAQAQTQYPQMSSQDVNKLFNLPQGSIYDLLNNAVEKPKTQEQLSQDSYQASNDRLKELYNQLVDSGEPVSNFQGDSSGWVPTAEQLAMQGNYSGLDSLAGSLGTRGGIIPTTAQNISTTTIPSLVQREQAIKGFDSQQKETNKSYDTQDKAAKKALEELIKSIQTQYATSGTEGANALNVSKQADLMKLSGLMNFNANQSPDSEQRFQYEQRTANDYAKQQADMMAKLAAAQVQDVSSANQNYQAGYGQRATSRQNALNQILQSKQTAQQGLADLMYKMQQDQQNRYDKYREALQPDTQKTAATYAPDGSYTYNEVDPLTGKKIFYDPKTGEGFYNA